MNATISRTTQCVIIAAFLAWAICPTVPARAQEPSGDDAIELASEVVQVPVYASDTKGKTVVDLKRDEFTVTDEGAPQEIAFFERDTAPVDVVLLVDTSGSTGATIDVIEKAALDFATNLRKQDSFSLLTFTSEPQFVLGWTNDSKKLRNAMSRAVPAGNTLLYKSADSAMRAMFELRPKEHRRAMVILTDGLDTGSMRYYSLDLVVETALARDVTIYMVVVNRIAVSIIDEMLRDGLVKEGSEADYRAVREDYLQVEGPLKLSAGNTGGRALFPEHGEDLSATYRQIASELQSRYLLGYYVPEGAQPGYRKIAVTTRRAGVGLQARAGYYLVRPTE